MKTPHHDTRALQLLHAIYELQVTYGYNPTLQEICHHIHLKAPSTIHYHLQALTQRGLVTGLQHTARTYNLTPHGLDTLVTTELIPPLPPRLKNSTIGALASAAFWERVTGFRQVYYRAGAKIIGLVTDASGTPRVQISTISQDNHNPRDPIIVLTPEMGPGGPDLRIARSQWDSYSALFGYIQPTRELPHHHNPDRRKKPAHA